MQDTSLFSYLVTQLPGLPVGQLILVINFKYKFSVISWGLADTVNQLDFNSSTG